jgi:hypothetical protein
MAQIPPNIDINPQNRGRESIPKVVGALTDNKFIPQAIK